MVGARAFTTLSDRDRGRALKATALLAVEGEAAKLTEHGLSDDGAKQRDVGPAGELGDDPAEAGVQVDLAAHDRGEHPPTVLDDSSSRLVTGRLDGEDLHQRPDSMTVLPGMPASISFKVAAYASLPTSSAHITSASSLVST